jgi:steroid delta-isomerase-like uncharacterized protein
MKGSTGMTSTEQLSAASGDYQATIRVKASPDALFGALTTVSGLAAWWNPATGSGEADGELRFIMNAPEPLVIHVDEATRPASVRWTVTDCPFLPDWIGTRPTFTITPLDGDTSELHFRHQGLNEELECIDMCTRSWNHYMTSLRDYLQADHGSPFGSPADKARREAQSTASASAETRVPAVPGNIEIIARFEHGFRTGDQATIDELCHPGVVDHNPAPGHEPTLAGFSQKSAYFCSIFPDLEEDRQDIIASGDTVATRWVLTGSQQREFMGIPAAGQTITVEGMNFYRLKDGRVTDIWTQFDGVAMMRQLGATPIE